MKFYYDAPRWDDDKCPDTCPTAKPSGELDVTDAMVIEAKDAWYRSAIFDGAFLVADDLVPSLYRDTGTYRAKVYCRWFGHRLKVHTPKFRFELGKSRIIKSYTGIVFTDLCLAPSKIVGF